MPRDIGRRGKPFRMVIENFHRLEQISIPRRELDLEEVFDHFTAPRDAESGESESSRLTSAWTDCRLKELTHQPRLDLAS